jgi:hypothetical protein
MECCLFFSKEIPLVHNWVGGGDMRAKTLRFLFSFVLLGCGCKQILFKIVKKFKKKSNP